MSENQTLLLIFALLYLSECISLVRADALAFVSLLSGRWRLVYPATLLGSAQSGLVFSNPLPPLGVTLFCPAWPLSLSPVGVYSYVSLTTHPEGRLDQEESYVPWGDVREVASYSNRLRVSRKDFARTGSAPMARFLLSLIDRVWRLPTRDRDRAIQRAIRESLAARDIRARVREYLGRSRWLRISSNLLFLYLFVLSPYAVWRFDLPQTWMLLLLGLVLLMPLNSFLFFRAHQALYPKEPGERMKDLFFISLLPTASLRAQDYLARNLLVGFHPLAAAQALCVAEDFQAIAKKMILDARHPMQPVCPREEAGPRETEGWYRAIQRSAMEEFVQSAGLELGALLRPPESGDATSRSYCPRCRLQYTIAGGGCNSCGGIALLPLVEM